MRQMRIDRRDRIAVFHFTFDSLLECFKAIDWLFLILQDTTAVETVNRQGFDFGGEQSNPAFV